MRGFIAQTKAESIRLLRSPCFLLFSVLMPLSFYALFTFINGAETRVGSVSWAAYSLMSMTAFSLIGTAAGQFGIRISFERKGGLLKLTRLTPLSTSAWIGGKIVSHLLVHVMIIAIMFIVSALVFGTDLSLASWLSCGTWLLAGSLPFLGLGILLGTIRNTDAATAVSNLVYMGISVAGGLWMPLSTFPEWFQSIGKWLPSYIYANGAWGLLEGGRVAINDIMLLVGYSGVFILAAIFLMNRREAE